MRNIGLVGAGAIGSTIIDSIRTGSVPGHTLRSILARSHQLPELSRRVDARILVTDDEDRFFSSKLDLVIEAAGHEAATKLGVRALDIGASLYLLSVGVLADPEVRNALTKSARDKAVPIIIPSGAFAGFDGLRALRQAELAEVTYTSIRPPHAWDGTPGQAALHGRIDSQAHVFFDGNASEAARLFPKSANLVASIAIAGIGFEKTQVRLISDPLAQHDEGRIEARGPGAFLSLSMRGSAFDGTPKSSTITGHSVIAAILNSNECVRFL